MTNNLYIILGPSYSGKTTLAKALEDKGYTRAITCTTRQKRGPEDTYIFLSVTEFNSLVSDGMLAEHAVYAGNHYGVLRSELRKADFCILEPQGARAIKNFFESDGSRSVKVVGLFPSKETLATRFQLDDSHGQERIDADEEHFAGVSTWCDLVIDPQDEVSTLQQVITFISREESMEGAS